MSYHEAESSFGLLVQVQRYMGQMAIGDKLSPAEAERLELLRAELNRRFPDGEA